MSPCAGAPQVSEAPQPLGERGFGEYGSKEQTFHIVIIYTFFVTVDRQMMTIYDKRKHTSTTLKRAVHPGGVPGGSTQQKRGMEARVEPSRARMSYNVHYISGA
jgi:hypothetical protein